MLRSSSFKIIIVEYWIESISGSIFIPNDQLFAKHINSLIHQPHFFRLLKLSFSSLRFNRLFRFLFFDLRLFHYLFLLLLQHNRLLYFFLFWWPQILFLFLPSFALCGFDTRCIANCSSCSCRSFRCDCLLFLFCYRSLRSIALT